jgi:hypothetical protein
LVKILEFQLTEGINRLKFNLKLAVYAAKVAIF